MARKLSAKTHLRLSQSLDSREAKVRRPTPHEVTGFYSSRAGSVRNWQCYQNTLLKAFVAGILPGGRRNMTFGLFYTHYGSGWLIRSITMGVLYNNRASS
jgi:hypothetical protein